MSKNVKSVLTWLALLLFICAVFAQGCTPMNIPVPQMNGLHVVVFGLALAFVWVEIVKIGKAKPFNCMKCMSAWLCLLLAVLFRAPFAPLYLFVGLFVGSLFEAAKMRYL